MQALGQVLCCREIAVAECPGAGNLLRLEPARPIGMRTTFFTQTPVRALVTARLALERLARDRRGAAMSEYVVVMGFVGLVSMPAFIYLGYVVANSFSFMRGYALYMYP